MDELDTWLGTSIGAEPLRAEVRQACGGSLEDLRSCELEDLENELSLSTWPPLERQRFLSAWRGLRGENDVDEAAADDAALDDAAADTDEEPAAAPRPPGPAPAPEPVSSPPPADAPRYAVGDQVEARWKGGERYYPALVLVARVDGSVDLRYTDDDTESRVHPSLLRPLSRRRGRARRVPPPPAPVAESSNAESEPAPAEPEPLASPMAEEPSDAESEPAEPAPSPLAEEEPAAPESEPVPAPPAPVPAPMAPEPDEPAPEDPDVKAGKERSRREQSEMDRALEAGRCATAAAAAAVDAAESSAVEATSNASEAVAADREAAGDRAVAAAAGARSHAAGSWRTATATAVDALDKAGQTEPPTAEPTDGAAAAPQPSVPPSSGTKKAGRLPKEVVPNERDWAEFRAKRDAAPPPPPAPVPPLPLSFATEPEPTEPPPISTPAVELAPPAAARAPSPESVAPDEPAPMDTTQSPAHDAPAAAASAMDVDATETASVLDRLRADMVRTVDIASRHNRPPNVDWRIGHTYSFLGAMHALGADTRAALAEALIRGRRGEIEPSTARRAVARILDGNLRTLERFQHTLRQISAPIASEATVSWFDPQTGIDLYAYSSCGAAAKEWGVRDVDIRACVEGRTPTANGLHFRRQTRWPVPAGSERVSEGVYRVGANRFRVQLGHDWGFLGNFDSAGAGALVHAAAWERLRHARRSLEAHTLWQLTEGATVDLSGCYVLLRRIASGTSFPPGFAVRKHRVPFAPFNGPHDAYFVSRQRGHEIPYGTELLNARVQRLERELTWWDPRDPSRGLCAQRLVARDGNDSYHGYHYQLVRRDGDAAAVDGNDASLVQLWRRTAVPAPVAPAPVVPPPPADWAQCATCDKWRVLPASVSAATLSDDWKCGDIGLSCSTV